MHTYCIYTYIMCMYVCVYIYIYIYIYAHTYYNHNTALRTVLVCAWQVHGSAGAYPRDQLRLKITLRLN